MMCAAKQYGGSLTTNDGGIATPYKWYVDVVIPTDADGQSDNAYDFGGGATRMGIIMPATWTTASVSFQVASTVDGTYYDLRNEAGTLVALTVSQGNVYSLETSASVLSSWRWVKVRSGSTSSPVTQDANRTLRFVFQR
jgi:hypothetical protein